jgi:hypothetical protein
VLRGQGGRVRAVGGTLIAVMSAVAGLLAADVIPARALPAPTTSPPLRASHFNLGPVTPGQVAPSGTSTVGGQVHTAAFANPGVLTYGDAGFYGSPTALQLSAPAVTMASTPDGKGYWIVAADGGVLSYGDAAFYGSAGDIPLYAPIVGMAPTPDGHGYWLVALDGGVFSFGDAVFYGSTGAIALNSPIVGMASTPDGHGYWLAAADGGIFSFGDAVFYGSMGDRALNSPIVGMASTHDGQGYWLVAADGGIFTFGDAAFFGSEGDQPINASVAAMAVTPNGGGYWLAGSDGAIYPFGDAVSYGSDNNKVPTPPVTGMAATADGGGYWLLDPDAFPTVFTHPAPASPVAGAGPIVESAAGQVAADPDLGYFCNPYGPCEEWCALFATWVWDVNGIDIPRYAFVGDIYDWAVANGAVLPPTAMPAPGEIVLYGTGPATVATSVHTGIVADVWPDGAIVTVEGDAGPGPAGSHNVLINGPFLPSHSAQYNGFPIYAYALP